LDSSGKIIFIKMENNTELNVESLANGIYLIEFVTDIEKIYRKLIKE
jgi:hypothetical protein